MNDCLNSGVVRWIDGGMSSAAAVDDFNPPKGKPPVTGVLFGRSVCFRTDCFRLVQLYGGSSSRRVRRWDCLGASTCVGGVPRTVKALWTGCGRGHR